MDRAILSYPPRSVISNSLTSFTELQFYQDLLYHREIWISHKPWPVTRADLTFCMISSDSWKSSVFRPPSLLLQPDASIIGIHFILLLSNYDVIHLKPSVRKENCYLLDVTQQALHPQTGGFSDIVHPKSSQVWSGWVGAVCGQTFSDLSLSRDVWSVLSLGSCWASTEHRVFPKPLLCCLGCMLIRVIIMLGGKPSAQSKVLGTVEQFHWGSFFALLHSAFPQP